MSTNYVFVLDTNRRPLNPCKPGVARSLLKAGKARVFRRYPFTIILNKSVDTPTKPVQLKLDPGSKTTGIALVQENQVLWGAELAHRGFEIKKSLESRRSLRRSRRNRQTRYRKARFLNRKRTEGWLAPSLGHRVETTLTWVRRLTRYVPVTEIWQELVRFDTHKMQNPEISGVEYQQGTLSGYEVREYLLEKWGRKCVYCGAENLPLQVEHITPRAKGGSNRVSNLTLACKKCNLKKGSKDIKEFLPKKPDLLTKIQKLAKQPLKDAAAVNSTRWSLFTALKDTGIVVKVGTGGQTKFNRCRFEFPKHHWIEAACVGEVEMLELRTQQPLLIKATGHGTRQMCGTDKLGFPVRHRSRIQIHKGFQTGDLIKAVVTSGKRTGIYTGRVLGRATGSFDVATRGGRVSGISYKYCLQVHQKDGYNYAF